MAVNLEKLRGQIQGRIISPLEAEYDAARALVYGGFDKRPAALVRVADAADVAALVNFARDNRIELAVRSGGHSGSGYSSSEGGLVLDLKTIGHIEVDAESRTAWVGAGATAAEVTDAAAAHYLAIGFGDTGSVGVGGITLGGGVGYLVRKHGLTIDSLLAADIVTADGTLLRIDMDNHPDLFWAIRGGGGNFGVVTRFKFRLQLLKEFTGGMLALPATPETIAGFIAATIAAPEDLSSIANVMPCPPMPFLPAETVGGLVIIGMLAYAGPPDAAVQALAPFRALAAPLADFVRPIPYPEIYPPEDPGYHPTAVSRTMFLNQVNDSVAKTMLEHLSASNASIRVVQLRVLGGAYARVANDATAYAHRQAPIMANVAAFYEGARDKRQKQDWVDRFAKALNQGNDGGYVNFITADDDAALAAAYPKATLERLRQVKRRYDPENFFRLNLNIKPA